MFVPRDPGGTAGALPYHHPLNEGATAMNNEERKVHLVGAGIASMAAAAYLIKDGGFSGPNITIYEQDYMPGGCLDARGDAKKGYNMQGERMFEPNYVCMYDLMSFIPSSVDPNKSVLEDTLAYSRTYPWYNKCRLVDKGKMLDADHYGIDAATQLGNGRSEHEAGESV
jgi:oleate hydratase